SPDPNSAVPVLPAVPEGKPTSAAVPSLTTAGISACSALLTAGSSFFGGTGLRPFASRASDRAPAAPCRAGEGPAEETPPERRPERALAGPARTGRAPAGRAPAGRGPGGAVPAGADPA